MKIELDFDDRIQFPQFTLNEYVVREIVNKDPNISITDIAKLIGVSRAGVYKMLKHIYNPDFT